MAFAARSNLSLSSFNSKRYFSLNMTTFSSLQSSKLCPFFFSSLPLWMIEKTRQRKKTKATMLNLTLMTVIIPRYSLRLKENDKKILGKIIRLKPSNGKAYCIQVSFIIWDFLFFVIFIYVKKVILFVGMAKWLTATHANLSSG